MLHPGDEAWSAEATSSEEGGLAVVQVAVANRDQTTRIAWGQSAKHSHEHGEKGHDHGDHDHDHGEHGHDH